MEYKIKKPEKIPLSCEILDPLWVNSHSKTDGIFGFVSENGVECDGEVFLFHTTSLPIGTEVVVFLGRNLYCVTKDAYMTYQNEKRLLREALVQKELADRNKRLHNLRKEAESCNAKLCIPVAWSAGIKSVLSGLSETSMGNGRSKATVEHIYLLEDLHDGSLHRKANTFLCSSNDSANGKLWIDVEDFDYDENNDKYTPKITCKKCLQIAQRWNKEL